VRLNESKQLGLTRVCLCTLCILTVYETYVCSSCIVPSCSSSNSSNSGGSSSGNSGSSTSRSSSSNSNSSSAGSSGSSIMKHFDNTRAPRQDGTDHGRGGLGLTRFLRGTRPRVSRPGLIHILSDQLPLRVCLCALCIITVYGTYVCSSCIVPTPSESEIFLRSLEVL